MNPRKRGNEEGEPIWGNPQKGDLDPCDFAHLCQRKNGPGMGVFGCLFEIQMNI